MKGGDREEEDEEMARRVDRWVAMEAGTKRQRKRDEARILLTKADVLFYSIYIHYECRQWRVSLFHSCVLCWCEGIGDNREKRRKNLFSLRKKVRKRMKRRRTPAHNERKWAPTTARRTLYIYTQHDK